MKLSAIIKQIQNLRSVDGPEGDNVTDDPDIRSLHYRSDQVRAGGLFVAIKGHSADGHEFVGDAISRGAVAVVAERRVDAVVPVVMVSDSRRALGEMADVFYGNPSLRQTIIGITGTNGKTTTAYILENMLKCQGIACGVIGTINYRYNGNTVPGGLTTPESLDLHRILAEMADAGVTHVVMEVSSHGVVLDRIAGCRFSVGVFTNLSQDHLDFHGDMDVYWACKKRFFTDYLRSNASAVAVINHDDGHGAELISEMCDIDTIVVGSDDANMVHPADIRLDQFGIDGRLILADAAVSFHSSLVGRFNLENILCAAGAGLALGLSPDAIRAGIETFGSVPGRLEAVENSVDRHVFVDFSHTPAALENVLTEVRAVIPGRLICVFGCGGDRDRGKRPQMGRIAVSLADLVIVTSDNPRTESPEKIIGDIVAGIPEKVHRYDAAEALASGVWEKGYTIVADRRQAIRLAVSASRPGDTIIIAGKGHEPYQIIGRTKNPFDDRIEAETALKQVVTDDDCDCMDN